MKTDDTATVPIGTIAMGMARTRRTVPKDATTAAASGTNRATKSNIAVTIIATTIMAIGITPVIDVTIAATIIIKATTG